MFSLPKRTLSALLGLSIVASLVVLPTAFAQEDEDEAKTPAALCEEALPNVTEPETRDFEAAEEVLEEGVDYQAIFCTENGAVYVDLFEDLTPLTVNNFVFLAQQGYYNNTTFHRVLADFMVQGGDPTGTGSGGPGYQFTDEFPPFLAFNTPGWLAMANAGPGTNGSQFFITRVPTPHLNGAHTIFGQVLEGQDIVDTMPNRDPQNPNDAAAPGATLQTVLILDGTQEVETDYVAPEPFTSEELAKLINEIPVDGYDLVDQNNETVEFETYGEAQSISARWEIAECVENAELFSVGLRLLDWGNVETPATVLEDADFLANDLAADFSLVEQDVTEGFLFSTSDELCNTAGVHIRYIWGRGNYTLILDAIIKDGAIPEEQLPVVASNLSVAFERFVGDAIYRVVDK